MIFSFGGTMQILEIQQSWTANKISRYITLSECRMPYAAVTLAFISTPNALHVFTLIASWSAYAMASFSRKVFFVANLYYDPIKLFDGLEYQREFLNYYVFFMSFVSFCKKLIIFFCYKFSFLCFKHFSIKQGFFWYFLGVSFIHDR